jgi:hypothetical protein
MRVMRLVRGPFVYVALYGLCITAAATPWIALVACDANSTNMSYETDIFSMARDRGARSAVSSVLLLL